MKPSTFRRVTRAVPESAFQGQVLALAKLRGWKTAHFRPAQNARGDYRTPVAGDGRGWPDLTLVRADRLIFAELKTDRGQLRPEQEQWLHALRQTLGPEVYVWRPRDFPTIEETLR